MSYSVDEMLGELDREMKLWNQIYPQLIEEKKIPEQTALRYKSICQAIRETIATINPRVDRKIDFYQKKIADCKRQITELDIAMRKKQILEKDTWAEKEGIKTIERKILLYEEFITNIATIKIRS